MKADVNKFAKLALENWSGAVFEATAHFTELKEDIVASLAAEQSQVRSAAVAALNEANCAEMHDKVVALAGDSDDHVREEVIEYLHYFATPRDARLLLDLIQNDDLVFLATQALNRLCDGEGMLIDDDDEEEYRLVQVQRWEKILRGRGYVI